MIKNIVQFKIIIIITTSKYYYPNVQNIDIGFIKDNNG